MSTKEEAELGSLFGRLEPGVAALGQAVRQRLRARLPGLNEIVYLYEGQGALVIAYSPSQHGYEGVLSLGVKAEGVKLHFARGAHLEDPQRLLKGKATARFILLEAAEDLDRPEVEALVVASLALAGVSPQPGAPGAVIFKVESQKARRKAR